MTSFIMKRKKYKFQIDFILDELSSVPFVNAVLFAKVRLHDGGSFCDNSQGVEVTDHSVKWGKKFSFTCKMSANASTGILESCICRVSVRKEVRGGRSFQRLGFAEIDLAEFAGAGLTSRRYLLEGYNTKNHRQDNSTLKVTIEMTLLSGDPCFKAPSFYTSLFQTSDTSNDPQLHLDRKGIDDCSGGSVASGSSGFGSLPRKHRPSVLSSDLVTDGTIETSESTITIMPKETESHCGNFVPPINNCPGFELSHSRNSSQASRISGYSSLPSHSRQGSNESGHGSRNVSSGSTFSDATKFNSAERKRMATNVKKIPEEGNRMDSTRVSADQLINELLENTNLEADEDTHEQGLALYVGRDGSTTLGSRNVKSRGFAPNVTRNARL